MHGQSAISARTNWLLALVSGGLQVVLFPRPSLGFLTWYALVPLLVTVVRAPTLKQSFFLSYASGTVFYLGTCYWVHHVLHTYGGLNSGVALALTVLFALYMSLWHGVFGLILALVSRRQMFAGMRALWLAPFAWVVVELGRTEVFGFPWDLLGTAQVDNIAFARLATVTGVWGLSLVIVAVNVVFAMALLSDVPRRRRYALIGGVIAVGLQLLTFWHAAPSPATHSARLVQQNVPILSKAWTQDYFDTTIAEVVEVSKLKGQSAEPRLIVWPESPAPFFTTDPKLRTWLATLARDQNAFVIAGTLGVTPSGKSNSEYDVFNSATLVAPTGAFADRYDKVHLVPFGEYIPMRNLLSFAESLTKQVSEFSRGSERKVFTLTALPAVIADQPADSEQSSFQTKVVAPSDADTAKKVAVVICYETAFPNEVRGFTQQGAQVLINISNDDWLGDIGAARQHLHMARMRAIENHRWVLRATNTGITVSIDPYGRVVSQASPGVRTALDAPYSFENSVTFYLRNGDWLAYACAIIVLLALFVRFRVRAASIS